MAGPARRKCPRSSIERECVVRLHVIMAAAIVAAASASAWAILPPPPPMTDEQKAKAEEAKENAAEAAKKEGELLAKYQDRAAENYKRNKGIKGGAPPFDQE